jgi:CRP-like cAMP-binding protein/phosphoribosyl 1,2-cyclic phosphodiesterase
VGTAQFLKENRINPRLIRDVILTHLHADHDAGLLPLIYSHPVRLRVHTFRSVYEGYLRKLEQKGIEDSSQLFDFSHVTCDQKASICGGLFDFDFSFHAIPTLRFKVKFGEKTIAYSADTFFEPETLKKHCRDGVFSEERLQSLLSFGFTPDVDLLIHESGVPPIHTPLSALDALPEEIKAKLLVVHCSHITLDHTSLRIPKCGIEHTVVLAVERVEKICCNSRLCNLMSDSIYFSELNSKAIEQLKDRGEIVAFRQGETLINMGDEHHDKVFMLIDGLISVSTRPDLPAHVEGKKRNESGFPDWPPPLRKDVCLQEIVPFCKLNSMGLEASTDIISIASSGTILGVSRLLQFPPPRNASLVAMSEYCILMAWEGKDIQLALDNTPNASHRILELAKSVWTHKTFLQNALPSSSLFSNLPSHLIEVVSSMIENVASYQKLDVILREGDLTRGLYCIREGRVGIYLKHVSGKLIEIASLGQGEFFGEMSMFGAARKATVVATEDGTTLLTISAYQISLLMTVPAIRLIFEKNTQQKEAQIPSYKVAELSPVISRIPPPRDIK